MASFALKVLKLKAADNNNDERGFFVLLEGSRIDMAAHANDPPTHVVCLHVVVFVVVVIGFHDDCAQT
jgi:alkaline phosphatase